MQHKKFKFTSSSIISKVALAAMSSSLLQPLSALQPLRNAINHAVVRFMSTQKHLQLANKAGSNLTTAQTEDGAHILGTFRYPNPLGKLWSVNFTTADIDVTYTEKESGKQVHFPAEALSKPPHDAAGFIQNSPHGVGMSNYYHDGEPEFTGNIKSSRVGTVGNFPPALSMKHVPAEDPWFPTTLKERIFGYSKESSPVASGHLIGPRGTNGYLTGSKGIDNGTASALTTTQHQRSLATTLRHWASFSWLSRRWQELRDQPNIRVCWGRWRYNEHDNGLAFHSSFNKPEVRVALPHTSNHGYNRMPGITAPVFVALDANGKPALRGNFGRIDVNIIARKPGALDYSFHSQDQGRCSTSEVAGTITVENGKRSFAAQNKS